jgi:RNA polymerase primary sigma factor
MTPTLTFPTATRTEPVRFLDALSPQQRAMYWRIPAAVSYVYHPSFASPGTENALFGRDAEPIHVPAWIQFPELAEDIPAHPAARPILRPDQEVVLFLRYNYARYRLARLLVAQRRRQTAARAAQIVLWHTRAVGVHAAIVRANMALVLAMAKRTRMAHVEFADLVSEGNMALLRTVGKFDVSRGFKFSTYACRAILKSFGRLATKAGRYRKRFPTEFDPRLERSDYDAQRHDMQRDDSVEALRDILARNRAALSEVEQTVVVERFAIGTGGKGRTLSEVGKLVGLTNERVRQIQNTALAKIRAALDEGFLVA